MEKLILNSPIMVNGEQVSELTYDVNEISVDQLTQAEATRSQALGPSAAAQLQKVAEFDPTLHLHVGMQAIIACNPKIDVSDLKRLKGGDAVQLMRIGRSFFTQSASTPDDETETNSESETSNELPEATPEHSIVQ